MNYKSYIKQEAVPVFINKPKVGIIIKRPVKYLITFILPLLALTGVILNITIFKSSEYTHMAAMQRTGNADGQRGHITDRNFIPFTGSDPRYDEDSLARHVIGYVNSDGEGVSGVEYEMDEKLSGGFADTSLKDARGESIPGFKRDNSPWGNRYVKLTLDYHIQKLVENVLESNNITGAVVVMEADSFDILAMASRPDFDQNNVGSYITRGSTALLNRALCPYDTADIAPLLSPLLTDSRATPLEVAEAMCTAAAGGRRRDTNLIDSIAAEDGRIIENMRKKNRTRIISGAEAEKINNEIYAGMWTAGYFPADNPQYVVVIADEGGSNGLDLYSAIKKEISEPTE